MSDPLTCTVHYAIHPKSPGAFDDCVMSILEGCSWSPDQNNPLSGSIDSKVISIAEDEQEFIIELSSSLVPFQDTSQWYTTLLQPLQSPLLTDGKIINIHVNNLNKLQLTNSAVDQNTLHQQWDRKNQIISSYQLSPHADLKNMIEESYLSWMGGIDIVRENPKGYSPVPFREKAEALHHERLNCEGRSQSRKLFIPHISGSRVSDITETLKHWKTFQGEAFHINLDSLGMAATQEVISLAHEYDMIVLGTADERLSALSPNAQLWWWRMLGVDILCIDSSRSVHDLSNIGKQHLPNGKANLLIGPDIHPGMVSKIVEDYGYGMIIESDTAIREHPYGIKAGADALTHALSCAKKGIRKEEAAERNENYKRALREWDSETHEHLWNDARPASTAS